MVDETFSYQCLVNKSEDLLNLQIEAFVNLEMNIEERCMKGKVDNAE